MLWSILQWARHIVSDVFLYVGVAGIPDNLKTWRLWLAVLDRDSARWMIFAVGAIGAIGLVLHYAWRNGKLSLKSWRLRLLFPEMKEMLASEDYAFSQRPVLYDHLKQIGIFCPDLRRDAEQHKVFLQSLMRITKGREIKKNIKTQNDTIDFMNEMFIARKEQEQREFHARIVAEAYKRSKPS